MKARAERKELERSLYVAVGVVEKKTTLPVLAHALLEASEDSLRVTATDLEIAVKRTCQAEVAKPGAVTIDARKAFEIVREVESDTVELTLEGGELKLTGGKSRFKLVTGDPKEFPSTPVGPPAGREPGTVVGMSAEQMLDVIDKTVFAAAEDDTRVQLTGALLELPSSGRLRMVATDGHRMAMVDRDVEGGKLARGVILPRKGLEEIRRVIDGEKGAVTLSISPGIALVQVGPAELSMRLVEGEFPDYQQVVKKEGKRVFSADHAAFLGALRRVSILSSDLAKGVRFDLAGGRLRLSAQSPEHGEAHEEIDVRYDGEEFSIGFNSRYFLQALAVMSGAGRVEVAASDEVSACLVRSEDDPGYLYVLMPLRT